MISKKYAQPLFMILMSLGMSVIMSGVVVAVNTGVAAWQSDWYDQVGLSTLPRGSMVTLWIDSSGSMYESDVAASLQLFEKNCQEGDLTINRKDGEFPGMYGGEAYKKKVEDRRDE